LQILLTDQYYCQFSQICLKPNKIVTISIGFQGFGNSIADIFEFVITERFNSLLRFVYQCL
jgi:hypothetical protein